MRRTVVATARPVSAHPTHSPPASPTTSSQAFKTSPPLKTSPLLKTPLALALLATVALAVLALMPPQASSRTLLQTDTQLAQIRQHIRSGHQPWASAWNYFRTGKLAEAMRSTPSAFTGPVRSGGVSGTLERALDRDGGRARNAGIGYALSGRRACAAKARSFLLAWAGRNRPTCYSDCGDKYMGTYQSHGAFSLAYAYDLTKSCSVYSTADRRKIRAYFRRFCDALETYVAKQRNEYGLGQTGLTAAYGWSSNPRGLRYNVQDFYVGGDLMALTQVARFALARVGGYPTEVRQLLNRSDILSVQSIVRHASAPRNSGDGVSGHPVPVPQVQIFKPGYYDNSSRGGCVDYMTYNERVSSMLLLMAKRAGADVSAELAMARKSWEYLGRFVGANAERSPAPRDLVSKSVVLPRFVLPLRLFGGDFLADARSGDERSYYESQFLGPVTITLWP